jgi:hypothetical protein
MIQEFLSTIIDSHFLTYIAVFVELHAKFV